MIISIFLKNECIHFDRKEPWPCWVLPCFLWCRLVNLLVLNMNKLFTHIYEKSVKSVVVTETMVQFVINGLPIWIMKLHTTARLWKTFCSYDNVSVVYLPRFLGVSLLHTYS